MEVFSVFAAVYVCCRGAVEAFGVEAHVVEVVVWEVLVVFWGGGGYGFAGWVYGPEHRGHDEELGVVAMGI